MLELDSLERLGPPDWHEGDTVLRDQDPTPDRRLDPQEADPDLKDVIGLAKARARLLLLRRRRDSVLRSRILPDPGSGGTAHPSPPNRGVSPKK
jgi:hypothetical protein